MSTRDAILADLNHFASTDVEAANTIGDSAEALAEFGSPVADALLALPQDQQTKAQEEIDELVQTCADEGPDPDQGSLINNEGFAGQVAYLLAYNSREFLKDSLGPFVPGDVWPDSASTPSLGR